MVADAEADLKAAQATLDAVKPPAKVKTKAETDAEAEAAQAALDAAKPSTKKG